MGYTITNRINVLIKKTYYQHERFQVDSTFALLYHENPLSVVELSQYVRISDQLIQMDDHHYFIIFAFTSHDNAYKAAQNIIHKLDNHFNATTCCIALDTFNATKSAQSALNRLEQILAETRKNPFIRIETDDILDRR